MMVGCRADNRKAVGNWGSFMGGDEDSVEVIVLGSGTSHGVPMIGCNCAVCSSPDVHDKRTRPSVFVRTGGQRILVDTATELRLQCIANGIDAIDAVLFTHHHADHVVGLDDLRRFNWTMQRHVSCYGTKRTLERIRQMFVYAFEPAPDSPHTRPNLELFTIDTEPFAIGDARVIPIPLMHGPLPVLGFRFGNFAYCTDCSYVPDGSMSLLRSLDVLMLDAVRRKTHPTHFNIAQAIEVAKEVNAKRTYFTHIAHGLMHEEMNRELPDGIELAYDGLRISTT